MATKYGRGADVVAGLFDNREDALACIHELHRNGFTTDQTGLVATNSGGNWNSYTQSGYTNSGQTSTRQSLSEEEDDATSVGTGAAAGAGIGAGVGALWAVGILAGALPAIGPAVAGGILGSLLASAGAGAAAGSMAGALMGMGMADEDATLYENEVKAGKTLVVVRGASDVAEAQRIIQSNGGRVR